MTHPFDKAIEDVRREPRKPWFIQNEKGVPIAVLVSASLYEEMLETAITSKVKRRPTRKERKLNAAMKRKHGPALS